MTLGDLRLYYSDCLSPRGNLLSIKRYKNMKIYDDPDAQDVFDVIEKVAEHDYNAAAWMLFKQMHYMTLTPEVRDGFSETDWCITSDIQGMFGWSDSPQGWEFWHDMMEKVQ